MQKDEGFGGKTDTLAAREGDSNTSIIASLLSAIKEEY
jgi:hypothetical protein